MVRKGLINVLSVGGSISERRLLSTHKHTTTNGLNRSEKYVPNCVTAQCWTNSLSLFFLRNIINIGDVLDVPPFFPVSGDETIRTKVVKIRVK
jgi:hypothetical protein